MESPVQELDFSTMCNHSHKPHTGSTHQRRCSLLLWAFVSQSVFFFTPRNRKYESLSAAEQYQKSRSQSSWQCASDLLGFSGAAFVWMSPSMTREADLIACCCCRCCRYTLGDDSMGEQVRSQSIVTNRSEISRGKSNCVKNSNLIIYKAAPRTLSASNAGSPSAAQQPSEDYLKSKKKRRAKEGKQAIL